MSDDKPINEFLPATCVHGRGRSGAKESHVMIEEVSVKRKLRFVRVLVVVGGAIVLLGVAVGSGGAKSKAAERTVYMVAFEPKGSANVADEPFPTQALPDLPGYVLEEPDAEGNWVVETYRWLPSEITVNEGDHVTLEILGVNGSVHPSHITGYDKTFVVKRGEVTTVDFVATKPGTFQIICDSHVPTMTASLVVLPAN